MSLAARTINIKVGASLDAAGGDLTVAASDTETGTDTGTGVNVTANAQITIDGASLTGDDVNLTATSDLTATSNGVFSGTQQANVGLVNGGSDTTVSVTGNSQITATGNVEISANSTTTSTVIVAAEATGSVALDAALATSLVTNSATAYLSGTTSVAASGTVSVASTNTANVTTQANGSGSGSNAAGTTVAVAKVGDTTAAYIDSDVSVHASAISVTATSTDDAPTSATSTAGGSTQNDATTRTDLMNNNASTSAGNIGVAGAVAINNLTRSTQAYIASSGPIVATRNIDIGSDATTMATAGANGSSTNSAKGVGVAVGINYVTANNSSYIGAGANLTAAAINVSATSPTGDTLGTKATSGAGAADVGVAGSLAINVVSDTTAATIATGASASVTPSGPISLTAQNTDCQLGRRGANPRGGDDTRYAWGWCFGSGRRRECADDSRDREWCSSGRSERPVAVRDRDPHGDNESG